ncbi:YybH family protein [Chryseobacterium sp. M5]|uniref:YybH family protein n=1 Tax=Chryseobacterium sp. M5 TaxID=3379128 RepID=UPI0038575C4C
MKPEDCDRLMEKGIQERNIDAMMSLFETNASFVTESGEIVSGYDAIKKALTPFLEVEDFHFIHLEAFPHADNNLAFLRGKWAAKRVDSDGKVNDITGNNIEVVRRQTDGSWLFVIDHADGAKAL